MLRLLNVLSMHIRCVLFSAFSKKSLSSSKGCIQSKNCLGDFIEIIGEDLFRHSVNIISFFIHSRYTVRLSDPHFNRVINCKAFLRVQNEKP